MRQVGDLGDVLVGDEPEGDARKDQDKRQLETVGRQRRRHGERREGEHTQKVLNGEGNRL